MAQVLQRELARPAGFDFDSSKSVIRGGNSGSSGNRGERGKTANTRVSSRPEENKKGRTSVGSCQFRHGPKLEIVQGFRRDAEYRRFRSERAEIAAMIEHVSWPR